MAVKGKAVQAGHEGEGGSLRGRGGPCDREGESGRERRWL